MCECVRECDDEEENVENDERKNCSTKKCKSRRLRQEQSIYIFRLPCHCLCMRVVTIWCSPSSACGMLDPRHGGDIGRFPIGHVRLTSNRVPTKGGDTESNTHVAIIDAI